MKRFIQWVSVLLLGLPTVAAAEGIIVSYEDQTRFSSLIFGMTTAETLVPDLNIQMLSPISRVLDSKKLLDMVRQQPGVRWAQLDHPVTMREVIPNDPDFSKQWSLKSSPNADIAATFAWNLGQGGKSPTGDDIVMAVVDQGVEVTHPSLKDNMWVNAAEIADNGIDDDGNGFVDDIYGWDFNTNSGNISAGYHGTHVAGIMGARGNDESQVTGVNWDAKIMSIKVLGYGGGSLTSRVLKAYNYILDQKNLWLESNGAQGANVVVTNSSFGVDRGDCTSGEYPAWNDIYNAMGEAGILSAAATANANWDIDSMGDVPTGCSSDYIIAVTNTQADGTKYTNAGYGKTQVDIGAPGTKVLSTYTSGGTSALTGTSMATPHVAGAVGFLYSVASRNFHVVAKENPGHAALLIKRAIMEFGTPQEDLKDKTVSGKRLNLSLSAQAISAL